MQNKRWLKSCLSVALLTLIMTVAGSFWLTGEDTKVQATRTTSTPVTSPQSGLVKEIISRQLVRIAQTGDAPPGGTGAVTSFDIVRGNAITQSNAPAVHETRRVVFVGRDASNPLNSFFNSGIFMGEGYGFITVADSFTNPLGIVGNLANFTDPAISPFGVVFSGLDASFRGGIFTDPTGATLLRSLAQAGDEIPIPGSNDTFNGVGAATISGVYVVHSGTFPVGIGGKEGIFVAKTITNFGSIAPNRYAVAITGDDPPGPVGPLALFGGFDALANSGATVVFTARDADYNNGIFVGSFPIGPRLSPPQRRLRTIISTGDPLPGTNGNFFTTGLAGCLDLDGQELVFRATDLNEDGIYLAETQTREI
jgi:hypothetical protein